MMYLTISVKKRPQIAPGGLNPHPGGQKFPTPQGKLKHQEIVMRPGTTTIGRKKQGKCFIRGIFGHVSLMTHVLLVNSPQIGNTHATL